MSVPCSVCILLYTRTESRKDGGLSAAGLSDHDGNGRVALLHRGVAFCEKVSAHSVSPCLYQSAVCAFSLGAHCRRASSSACSVPCRSAVLAGLAEQKAQLLQPVTERIFGRHVRDGECCVAINWCCRHLPASVAVGRSSSSQMPALPEIA
jgi:hypothetical protein